MYTQYLDLYLTFGEIQSQVTVEVALGMCGDEMEKDRRNNQWRRRGRVPSDTGRELICCPS